MAVLFANTAQLGLAQRVIRVLLPVVPAVSRILFCEPFLLPKFDQQKQKTPNPARIWIDDVRGPISVLIVDADTDTKAAMNYTTMTNQWPQPPGYTYMEQPRLVTI